MTEHGNPPGPDDNAELVDRLEEEAKPDGSDDDQESPDAAGSDTAHSVPGAPEPPD